MRYFTAFIACLALLGAPRPAGALPVFAHRYGFSCQQCHTAVPHLNAFGEAFRANGFSLSRLADRTVFPIAVKVNLAYSSAADPSGLPKEMVDEVELLTGGHIGKNVSYFGEQYAVDGGKPGDTRDAWVSVENALSVRMGQFTLPLPVDVEDERDTLAHYAVFDQTIGKNPFSLFAPKMGADMFVGSHDDGATLHVAFLDGHDAHAALGGARVDRMIFGQIPFDAGSVSAYRYDGSRPIAVVDDRFWRQGLGADASRGDLRLDAVLQHGWDASANGFGLGAASSGGFVQARWEFAPSFFAIARYDGTRDDLTGMQRSFTASIVTRPARNMRFTVEGTISSGSTSVGSALLFAY